jgi:cold shock CspA family protein
MQITINWEDGIAPSDAIEARVRAEASKLLRVEPRIASVRVALRHASSRRHKGDLYAVRLQFGVPGGADVTIGHNPDADHAHEDAYVAIRDAFRAARRRLQERHRRLSGIVKTHRPQATAKVSQLFADGDYGFMETEDGREIYFHRNAVLNGGFQHLRIGDRVRFVESEGDKGAQASTVVPVS